MIVQKFVAYLPIWRAPHAIRRCAPSSDHGDTPLTILNVCPCNDAIPRFIVNSQIYGGQLYKRSLLFAIYNHW